MKNSVGQNARIVTGFQRFMLLPKEIKAEMESGANVHKMTPDSTAQGLYILSVYSPPTFYYILNAYVRFSQTLRVFISMR